MRRPRGFFTVLFTGLMVAGLAVPRTVLAQGNEFQLIVGAVDAAGMPVTDLKVEDVIVIENGVRAWVDRIEPYSVPVKLTLAVDNGIASREALAHYRSGLTGLVQALPYDVEVTLITTAPQPLMVVRPTTDRLHVLRGINQFAPEDQSPRFTDALVEFSQRLDRELSETRTLDSLPILVMISTTANEATSYQVGEIDRALRFLVARKARLMVAITSTRSTETTDMNTNRQAIIAIPATEATRGRYEALSISNRLTTLLPEMGRDIANLHAQHTHQFRVTVQRPNDATGPLRGLQVGLSRPGMTGSVSVDGLP